MKLLAKYTLVALMLAVTVSLSFGQQKEASPFDFGRMWTFENPPVEWFQKEYGIKADKDWFKDVQMSSLRFATWCSASFVSPDGLIMTNHHCSRDVAVSIQKEGENFDKNGFYAATKADERRAPDLFVERLVMIADITDEVKAQTTKAETDADALALRREALESIKEKYSAMNGWKGLRLQTVTYYSGGKYSLYGYKRYDDIRLVLIPEYNLGFFGGDPDNFTYPRYSLDFTFWRAYDENGQPLNTKRHHLEFNPDGIEEGTPVFVVGNPGSTERYRTVAQLEYDRDYRYKFLHRWLSDRRDLFQEEYDMMKKDESKSQEAQELLGTINNFSNSIKAIGGIIGGLHDKELFDRKKQMERKIRAASPGVNHWDVLDSEYKKLLPHGWAVSYLSPSPINGKIFQLMHQLYGYKQMLGSASEEDKDKAKEDIINLSKSVEKKDFQLLSLVLNEIRDHVYPGDNTVKNLLAGKSVDAFVKMLKHDSKLLQSEKDAAKCLAKDKNITKSKDPLIKAADNLIPKYMEAGNAFRGSSPKRKALEAKIANQVFNVYGTSLPPDATFTLRISDGIVKGYEYNGTTAPIKTTFFGLYDRYYSHNKTFPWDLPKRWQNPPMGLLKSPYNFVSTNDIIGGNSGSPVINQKGEAVGLIFDGNIESLPGNFIYDEEYNRSVSVHAGGIYAALKYIFKADRLLKELVD